MSNTIPHEALQERIAELEQKTVHLEQTCRVRQRSADLLNLIRKAQSQYIIGRDPAEIYRLILQTLVEITESEYGFLDEVVHDAHGHIHKKSLAISNISWDERSKSLYRQLQDRNLKFTYLDNLAGLPALTGQTVISNDPSADKRSKGVPEGHPKIRTFLGMPVFFGGKLICVAGVANRKGGYTEDIPDFLEPLLSVCGSITYALQKDAIEKKNQNRLAESESKYRLIVENQNDLILKLDKNMEIVFASPSCCRVFGVDEQAILGKSVISWLHRDDAGTVEASLERLRQPPHVAYLEQRAETVEGWRWFGWSTRALLNDDADLSEIVAVGRDITHRKRAEERLRESEERYRTLFLNSPLGIFRSTFEGRFLEVNPALAHMLGYGSPEEVIEKIHSIGDQIYIKSEERKKIVSDAFRSDGVAHHVNHYRRKDGSVFIANLYLKTICGDESKPAFLEGIVEDITEVKKIEGQLKRQSHIHQAIIDHAHTHLVYLDTDFNFVAVNDKYAETCKRKPEELIGKNHFSFYPHAENEAIFNRVRDTGRPVFFRDKPFAFPDQPERGVTYWDWTLSPVFDGAGHVEGLVFSLVETTERKQAEASIQQLKKAESLGRMAGAIAHRYNNLLSVVTGNLELALEDVSRGVDSAEKLAEAMTAAKSAAEIGGMMQVYLGQTPLKPEPIDLSGVCRGALSDLKGQMPATIALETDLPEAGPTANAHPSQIRQILHNLLVNAWEATGDRPGRVSVAVRPAGPADIPAVHRWPVEFLVDGTDYACLEVTDTGCGISEEDIDKLFDPFYSTRFTGRGLGLPVVLGIAKALGGCVALETEKDRGSVFRIFLPVSTDSVRAGHSGTPPQTPTPAPDETPTVLLVEDEAAVRRTGMKMLMRLGVKVVEAVDGVAALSLFQLHPERIHCVLCDLSMPRMDGWETIAGLRRIRPGIPVVLISGFHETQALAGEHPEQPQAFLTKPYQLDDLRRTLTRILGGLPASQTGGGKGKS